MKTIIILASIITVVSVLVGCQSGCLSVTGGYEDATGTITWCKDLPSSQAVQRTVLVEEDGERALIVTESEMKKINDKIDSVTAKFISKKETVLETFLERIK